MGSCLPGLIVLDTIVVSEPARPRPSPEVIRRSDSQVRPDLYPTVITVSELFSGAGLVPPSDVSDRFIRDNESVLAHLFLGRIRNLDQAAASEYAEILVNNRVNHI